ncbi:hypothetical protein ACLOJK_005177 [Asimina triloba]
MLAGSCYLPAQIGYIRQARTSLSEFGIANLGRFCFLCAAVVNLGVEIGCMITKGPWIFVGLVNAVKAWNMETNNEISLSGPVGQVYSLEANDELLFAGSQDGSILVWKFNDVGSSFEPAATLQGYNLTNDLLVPFECCHEGERVSNAPRMQEAALVAIVALPKRPELTELLSAALGCGIHAHSSSSAGLKMGWGRVLERTEIIGVGTPLGGDIRMEERAGKAIAAATLPLVADSGLSPRLMGGMGCQDSRRVETARKKTRRDANLSLTVGGARRLYSGSMDNTIRVWDLGTFQCLQTLMDHTSVVMSLLCWDHCFRLQVWAATESGSIEVTYTHNAEHGVLGLCGMHDVQAKPVLMCACDDNAVRVYDLPSFKERGKVLSKDEIRSIQLGPDGLFFTGDRGALRVWKWRTT